ncbi:hypothetical protein C4J89_2042 [Pseudomonas sp. R4-35-07]|nr:hypothetical protein C4J92_2026 [Pseudomonas sp. R3-18-08]AZF26152.1 hypothetical protein C4J90_1979 [Pseudomonas sp. R2-60-08W]AZF31517.1 hypothetical protein C4J89_2042 [Pseudomonas sp. R4-35-07]AZF36794.1 hypothetical protein C4J88_2011 [Pseudomonas sp. R4-39-08]AZF52461.1 hypothetical protein C4J85_1976 [Pseudomonas sp. R4-34-07]
MLAGSDKAVYRLKEDSAHLKAFNELEQIWVSTGNSRDQ